MWDNYVCKMVTHNAIYIYHFTALDCHTHAKSLSQNQWPYSGAVWEKRIGQMVFQKPCSHSVLKLSLRYQGSYLSQTVLPINELLLSFYITEIILKLKCKNLYKSDIFDWTYAMFWTANSTREKRENNFGVFSQLTKLVISGRKTSRLIPFMLTLKHINTYLYTFPSLCVIQKSFLILKITSFLLFIKACTS